MSDLPVTKNWQMCTVYAIDFFEDNGYNTDFTARTQNSKGRYVLAPEFNANSALYDVTGNVNSNVEIIEGSQYDLNINAVAATKGILCQKGQQK